MWLDIIFFLSSNTRLSPSFFATSDTMSAAKRQKTAFQIDLSAYKSLKINPFTQVRKAPDEWYKKKSLSKQKQWWFSLFPFSLFNLRVICVQRKLCNTFARLGASSIVTGIRDRIRVQHAYILTRIPIIRYVLKHSKKYLTKRLSFPPRKHLLFSSSFPTIHRRISTRRTMALTCVVCTYFCYCRTHSLQSRLQT